MESVLKMFKDLPPKAVVLVFAGLAIAQLLVPWFIDLMLTIAIIIGTYIALKAKE